MKKYIASFILSLLLLGGAAFAADAFVLSTDSSSNSVTTKLAVARVQGDPAPDGTLTPTAYLKTVVTAPDGTVLAEQWVAQPVTLQLSPELAAQLSAAIAAAKEAAGTASKPAAE